MKIIVITMPKRLNSIKNELDLNKLDYEIFDAVNLDNKLNYYIENVYDKKEFILNMKRYANIAEIGCYASHILVWEKIIQYNEPCIVIEDDIIIKSNFKNIINFLSTKINDLGFIRISNLYFGETYINRKILRCIEILDKNNLKIVKFLRIPCGTNGYIITPKVAKIFLKNSSKICIPVDTFISNSYIHKQPIYGIFPGIVDESHQTSLIGEKSKDNISFICYIYFNIRKLFFMLYSYFTNFTN